MPDLLSTGMRPSKTERLIQAKERFQWLLQANFRTTEYTEYNKKQDGKEEIGSFLTESRIPDREQPKSDQREIAS